MFEAWTKPELLEQWWVPKSKEALDAARESGAEAGTLEAFEQLDELVVTLGASVGPS